MCQFRIDLPTRQDAVLKCLLSPCRCVPQTSLKVYRKISLWDCSEVKSLELKMSIKFSLQLWTGFFRTLQRGKNTLWRCWSQYASLCFPHRDSSSTLKVGFKTPKYSAFKMWISPEEVSISQPIFLSLYVISLTKCNVFEITCFTILNLGITDFSLRVALQTLLKEYTEVTKSPKENKMYCQLQPAKMRPRRKARKYLYAIGSVSFQTVCLKL